MTPLPKRRHSTRRSGKREKVNMQKELKNTGKCKKCGHPKLPHQACGNCGFYK